MIDWNKVLARAHLLQHYLMGDKSESEWSIEDGDIVTVLPSEEFDGCLMVTVRFEDIEPVPPYDLRLGSFGVENRCRGTLKIEGGYLMIELVVRLHDS